MVEVIIIYYIKNTFSNSGMDWKCPDLKTWCEMSWHFQRKCQEMSGNVRKCQKCHEMSILKNANEIFNMSGNVKYQIWVGNVQTSISGLDISRNVKKCHEMSILKNANEIFNMSGNVLVEYFQSIWVSLTVYCGRSTFTDVWGCFTRFSSWNKLWYKYECPERAREQG